MFGDPVAESEGVAGGGDAESRLSDLAGGTPPSAKEWDLRWNHPFHYTGSTSESSQPIKRTVTDAGAEASRTVDAGATLAVSEPRGKIDKSTVEAFNQIAVEWGERIHADFPAVTVMRFL